MKIWTRLGISVAILAIFCFVATEAFKRHPELHPRKKAIAVGLAGVGTLLWLIGKVHSDQFKNPNRIFTIRFFGSILAACAGIVTNITPIQQAIQSPASILNLARRTNAREAATTNQTLEQKSEASTFSFFRRPSKPAAGRPLRVQGIIFQRKDPSAIINGKTVFVGDHVGEARVVAIARNAVTVEVERQTCVLALQ